MYEMQSFRRLRRLFRQHAFLRPGFLQSKICFGRSRGHWHDQCSHANADPNDDQAQAQAIRLDDCSGEAELSRHLMPVDRLSSLPEELLVLIIEAIRDADDAVAMHCLRCVSGKFMRLTEPLWVWKPSWYLCSIRNRPRDGRFWMLKWHYREQLESLLLMDGMCQPCAEWTEAHKDPDSRRCPFRSPGHDARGIPTETSRLYCNACDAYHDSQQFSPANLHDSGSRICLGQQGSVKLCEHVHITWASIQAHIETWRRKHMEDPEDDDLQRCINDYVLDCRHPSHDVRCYQTDVPTWPRAQFYSYKSGGAHARYVDLEITWESHLRVDVSPDGSTGRVPELFLQEGFEELRARGPAIVLFAAGRPREGTARSGNLNLSEMLAFGARSAVHRVVVSDDMRKGLLPRTRPDTTDSSVGPGHSMSIWRWYGKRGRSRIACRDMTQSSLSIYDDPGDLVPDCFCVRSRYSYRLVLFPAAGVLLSTEKLSPSDGWLHSMALETYEFPQGWHVRPMCENQTCRHYLDTQFRRDCASP
jgi:hypothetical protein